jgi:hypothetical protein
VARAGCGRARSAWSIEVNCVGGHSRTLAHGHPLLGRADYSMDDATEGRSIGRMSWDEAFAERYDEWAAHMTEDISCPFRALLHLPTWADRRRTFEGVAGSLQPGGRFAWNAFAFDHQIAARLDGRHHEEPVSHTIRYAVGDNRIDTTLDDGGTSSLWWATKNEWLGLVDVAGLEVEALYGGFDREPVDDESREYVFIATRRN